MKTKRLFPGIAITALLFLAGCGGYSVTGGPGKLVSRPLQARTEHPRDLLTVSSVAVFPPEVEKQVSLGKLAPETLYSDLGAALQDTLDLELLSGDRVAEAIPDFKQRLSDADARAVGVKLGSDAILRTTLSSYEERVGSRVGADKGARVSFSMRLVRVADGKEVWRASYHFEDQALSDNLFRLPERFEKDRAGKGWLSAQDLLNQGFTSAARDINQKRLAQFAGS